MLATQPHRCSSLLRRVAAAALAIALTLAPEALTPPAAQAHVGIPMPAAFWGPFTAPAGQCVRTISHGTRRCFHQVLIAKRRCMDQQLRGAGCDQTALSATVSAALAEVQNVVDAACLGGQLTELKYSTFDEAESDVSRACGDQTDIAIGLIYAPVVATGTFTPLSPQANACLVRVSALSQKFLEMALQLKGRAFDRISMIPVVSGARRIALLDRADARIANLKQKFADRVHRECPAFDTVYQRTADWFMAALLPRTDCVVFATCIQSDVSCPLPICGNGITEPGESCDDGNQIDTDACRNNCTRPQ